MTKAWPQPKGSFLQIVHTRLNPRTGLALLGFTNGSDTSRSRYLQLCPRQASLQL
jgi:hypothetical protein